MMMIRVCFFVCIIALSGLPVAAQESATGTQSAAELSMVDQLDVRLAGFELQPSRAGHTDEDTLIFAPLAPVAVDAEPVKLPPDQQPE